MVARWILICAENKHESNLKKNKKTLREITLRQSNIDYAVLKKKIDYVN